MTTQYLGQIEAFAFNFAPKGWAQCNGQLLSIQQNAALFALLGTYYGGNGVTTFQLPDLRGRVAVSQGTSTSGSNYVIGEVLGTENVSLIYTNMPAHTHAMNIVNSGTASGSSVPGNTVQLASGVEPGVGATPLYAPSSNPQVALENLGLAGGSLPHPNVMPYLTINYCISLTGIFPTQG
jgi:microcystin-dependent protein